MEELKIVEVRMSGLSDACIMTFFLQYSKSGDEEFLEGTYTSMNTRDSSNCGRGTVFLRRVVTSDFYKEPFLVKREKEKEEALKKEKETPTKVTPVETAIPLVKLYFNLVAVAGTGDFVACVIAQILHLVEIAPPNTCQILAHRGHGNQKNQKGENCLHTL